MASVINALVLVVLVLAVARVSRLITTDDLFLFVRTYVIRRFGEESKMTTLVFCPWCISVWFGIAMAGLTFLAADAPKYVAMSWHVLLTGLAASYVTGLLAKLEG
jgi:hypothetical protein